MMVMVMSMVMVNCIVRSFHGLTGWGDRGVGSDVARLASIAAQGLKTVSSSSSSLLSSSS